MADHYSKPCREVYSKTLALRIVSTQLTILDGTVMYKPSFLFYIELNGRASSPFSAISISHVVYRDHCRRSQPEAIKTAGVRKNNGPAGKPGKADLALGMINWLTRLENWNLLRDCARNPGQVVLLAENSCRFVFFTGFLLSQE